MVRLNIWNEFPITVQGRDEFYDAYFQMALINTVNILREENLNLLTHKDIKRFLFENNLYENEVKDNQISNLSTC